MDANGGDHKVVVNRSVENMDFDVYNNKIFWIDESSKKVFFSVLNCYIASTVILNLNFIC